MPARRRRAARSVTTMRRPSVRSQPRLANEPIAWLTLCREPPAISASWLWLSSMVTIGAWLSPASRRGAEARHRTSAQDDQGLAGIVLHEQQLTLAVRARDRRGDHPLPDFGLQSGEHVHAGQRVARVRQPYLHEPTLPK